MSTIDKYSRRIANYMYDDMEAVEREEFEADLQKHTDLATEYNLQSSVLKILKAKSVLEDLRTSPDLETAEQLVDEFINHKTEKGVFNEIPRDVPTDPVPDSNTNKPLRSAKIRRLLYPVAAAAAILAGVVIIRFYSDSGVSDRMFNTYYEPLDYINFTVRGEGDKLNIKFTDAVNLYNDKVYVNSSVLLAELVSENPDFPEPHFYLGLSKLGEGKYVQAAEILRSYVDNFDKYQAEATWYLTLCYLKAEKLSQAHDLVSELTGIGGSYGKDATTIQRNLSRLLK